MKFFAELKKIIDPKKEYFTQNLVRIILRIHIYNFFLKIYMINYDYN